MLFRRGRVISCVLLIPTTQINALGAFSRYFSEAKVTGLSVRQSASLRVVKGFMRSYRLFHRRVCEFLYSYYSTLVLSLKVHGFIRGHDA